MQSECQNMVVSARCSRLNEPYFDLMKLETVNCLKNFSVKQNVFETDVDLG